MKQKRGRVSDGEQDHDDHQEIFIVKSDAARDRARVAKKRANQHHRVFISVSTSSFASEWALRNKGGDFNVAARYGTYGEGGGDGVLEKEWQTLMGKAIFYTDCDAIKCLIEEEGVDLEQPCAYEVERVTCEGPVMLMYRPLTYAVRHDIPKVTRMLLNRRVNRTHAPTDVFPELQVSRYDRSMDMLGRYDAWLSCMYATLWTTRYLVKEHGWRDVGPIIVSMIDLVGDHAWLADVPNINVRYW
jgi:hypothetical protein